jgi:hypothetical protein
MKTRTITSKADAYTARWGPSSEDLLTLTDATELYFLAVGAMHAPEGWSKVGTATITVEIADTDALIANKVESLKAELQAHRSNSQVKENELQDKISKLLAITYEATA